MIWAFLYIIAAGFVGMFALVIGGKPGEAFLWSLFWPVSLPLALWLSSAGEAHREAQKAQLAEARRLAAVRALQARMIEAGPGQVSRPMIGVPDYD